MARAVAFHYSRTTPPDASYEREGVVVVLDWLAARIWKANVARIRAAGGECLHYLLPPHDYPGGDSSLDKGYFYNGRAQAYSRAAIPKSWYWDPANPGRVTVPNYGGFLMDLRAGSAFSGHVAESVEWLMDDPTWDMDGVMLDVVGSGWLGFQSGLTMTEQAAYKAGNVALIDAIRGRCGDEVIVVNNNSWAVPHPRVNGITVENHGIGEKAFWQAQMEGAGSALPAGRRRNLVIVKTAAEAVQWAAVPGATHVTAQANYSAGAKLPYSGVGADGWGGLTHLKGWDSTSGTTTPPPPPPSQGLPLPVAPTGLVPVLGPAGSGTVNLDWADAPAAEAVDSFVAYKAPSADAPDSAWIEVARGIPVSAVTVPNLTPGVKVALRVSAHNASARGNPADPGHGPWSAPVEVTPPVAPPPPSGDCESALAQAIIDRDLARSERDTARAAGAAVTAELAGVRSRVAAVGQQIPGQLAGALEGEG